MNIVHITKTSCLGVYTICGELDTHETIREEHYLEHVAECECCDRLRERLCPKCLEKIDA